MLKSKCIACVVIREARIFDRLGNTRVIDWSMTQLLDVRGIDQIIAAADKRHIRKAQEWAKQHRVSVIDLPRTIDVDRLDSIAKWLGTVPQAQTASIFSIVVPTNPFLPAAKIEACVDHVRRGRCGASLLSRDVGSASMVTAHSLTAELPLNTFRVFRPNVTPSARTVAINLLESLDVTKHDEYVMAEAMIEGKRV